VGVELRAINLETSAAHHGWVRGGVGRYTLWVMQAMVAVEDALAFSLAGP